MRLSTIMTSATTGEVTPRLEGRVDLSKFYSSFRRLENYILYPHGPYTKRDGTYFVAEAKYRDKCCREVPFVFSLTQSYALEFGDYYMRVFMDGGSVAEAFKTITGITQAAQAVVTSAGHGYANGDEVFLDEIGGMIELNGNRYRVSDKDTNTFKIKDLAGAYINSTGFGAYTSGGKAYRIYEITTPFSELTALSMQFSQTADIMYITCGDLSVYKLTRTGHTAWTISAVDFVDGPYLPDITMRHGVTPGAVAGSTTLTAVTKAITAITKANPAVVTSAAHGYSNGDIVYIKGVVGMTEVNGRWYQVKNKATDNYQLYDLAGDAVNSTNYTTYTSGGTSQDILFSSGDVNRLIRFLCTGSVYRWAKITAYTSETVVTAMIKSVDLPDAAAIKTVRMGYWSTGNGYPYTVTFHEQRLIFGGSPEYPNTIWGSRMGSDSFEDFTPGTLDDDPIIYTLTTDQVNAIRWLSSGTYLSVGTGDAEFSLRSNSLNEPLSPTNIKANREDTGGGAYMMPLRIGRGVIFVQRLTRKLMECSSKYTEEGDTFNDEDLTLLAEHITEGGIVDFTFQKEPNAVIWCVLGSGTLAAMTYQKQHDVLGWHEHDVGGVAESICCIPEDTHDQVWMSVARTIDGVERRYIEYFNPTDYKSDVKDAFFVDCGLTYDGAPTVNVSGFGHLEGETVAVLADGIYIGTRTISNGQFDEVLETAASVIHAGLPFISLAEYQRPEPAIQQGTIQNKKKRVVEAMLRVLDSYGGKVGGDEDHLDELPYAQGNMGEAVPLFSGDIPINPPEGETELGNLIVVHDIPLPFTVVAVVPKLEIGEE